MTLLSVAGEDITNPAFSRMHGSRDIVYCCTEDISKNGRVMGFKISESGE